MSDYEQKRKAKRERYAARAEKKRGEAEAASAAHRGISDRIPMGQPILTGHHSEHRHRKDLARMDRQMSRAIDATTEAKRLERKAETYGTHGVSSDDPEAVAKLREKLAKLEAQRETYKAHNRKARKEGAEKLPAYVLSNLGANIRRYRQRIEALETTTQRPVAADVVGDGFRIVEDKDDNRVRFYFDERPSKEVCRKMRATGFKWARSVGAWQRQLNNAGIYAAERMARELFGKQT